MSEYTPPFVAPDDAAPVETPDRPYAPPFTEPEPEPAKAEPRHAAKSAPPPAEG